MTDRRGFWGAVLIAALLLARSPAGAGAPPEARAACATATAQTCVSLRSIARPLFEHGLHRRRQSGLRGRGLRRIDANCGAICNTPVPTPTSTATVTATVTATIISTPGPAGAPASSPRGLAIGVGMLALIAALALRRRRI